MHLKYETHIGLSSKKKKLINGKPISGQMILIFGTLKWAKLSAYKMDLCIFI